MLPIGAKDPKLAYRMLIPTPPQRGSELLLIVDTTCAAPPSRLARELTHSFASHFDELGIHCDSPYECRSRGR
jgi:hypothetical protein